MHKPKIEPFTQVVGEVIFVKASIVIPLGSWENSIQPRLGVIDALIRIQTGLQHLIKVVAESH